MKSHHRVFAAPGTDLWGVHEHEGAHTQVPFVHSISPYREMGAYEALWERAGTTFKRLAEQFAESPGTLPSNFVPPDQAEAYAAAVYTHFQNAGVPRFGVRVHGDGEYPPWLRDAVYPVELLYYVGRWELVWKPSVAVVGTRKPTSEGIARTRKLTRALVDDGFLIASGLAAGVDTAAHETAIEAGGDTIAVIGTPLSSTYPRHNAALQKTIAAHHLLISQVPVRRYEQRDYRWNRFFFPERNATMSALTKATVIVEAGEGSGALIQGRQALRQGRKLFILDSCFRRGLDWPVMLETAGAIKVQDYGDIKRELSQCGDPDRRVDSS